MLPKKTMKVKNGMQLHTQNEVETEEPGIDLSGVIAVVLVLALVAIVFSALNNGSVSRNMDYQERQQLIQELKERSK